MTSATVSSFGVGVAHLPNQKHRIVSKKGAHFTLMVCGNYLKMDLVMYKRED